MTNSLTVPKRTHSSKTAPARIHALQLLQLLLSHHSTVQAVPPCIARLPVFLYYCIFQRLHAIASLTTLILVSLLVIALCFVRIAIAALMALDLICMRNIFFAICIGLRKMHAERCSELLSC